MKMFLSCATVALVAALFAESVPATVRPAAARRVTILHTNDSHTHADDGVVPFSEIAAVKRQLQRKGENVVLVDAGDHVQGTALGGYDEGRSIIDIMSAAGYDAATLGNHEFDYGIATLFRNLAAAKFPSTSCNLIHRSAATEAGQLVLPSYLVVTSGTVRVGFVGVTTPTAVVSAKPSTFLDTTRTFRAYDFLSGDDGRALYRAVQTAIDAAAAVSDFVVVLSHLGVEPDCVPYRSTDVIAHTTNAVAFIDGHSHSEYTGSRVKNAAGQDVILTQSGSYLGILGSLTVEDGRVVSAGTVYSSGEKEPTVAVLEKKLIDTVERKLGEKLAEAATPLYAYVPNSTERLSRSQECSAGDFAADAYWWYASEKKGLNCDFALLNGGNVRADIPKGSVSFKTLRTVQPFAGDVAVVEVNGRQVLDALEFGAAVAGKGESGGFLQVAGLKYTIDTSTPCTLGTDATGSWIAGPSNGIYRVRDVQVYDRTSGSFRPLDLNGVYRVTGSTFTLVEGGDGFAMFRSARLVNNAIGLDYLVLADYVKAFKATDGLPCLSSAAAPLAAYPNYPLAYERATGSGRIVVGKKDK